MLGGRTAVRPSWPPAPGHAPVELPPPPPAHQATDGLNRYGLYSLFPGDVYATPRYAHTQPAPSHAPGHAQYHASMLPPPPNKECVFSPVVERGISQLQELMSKRSRPATRPRRDPPEVKQEPCACRDKTSTAPVSPGCSRTTPVTLKREPGGGTPCQVAEVTTSAVKIKQELPDLSPTSSNGSGGSIPVGIAVARQRCVQESRVKEDPTNSHAPGHVLGHSSHLHPHPHPPPPPISCSAAVDQALPVGYQLARDPVSGQLLLISAPTHNIGNNNIGHLSAGVMWPPSPLVLPPAQPTLLLDRLVTLAAPTPPPPPPHRRPHLEPALTGVLPCGKSSVVIAQQVSSAAAQVSQQAPVSQYCAGSVLIQHISGATQPAVIPHHPAVSGSVLISTQQLSAEAQSLLGGSVGGGLVLSQDSTIASPHSMLHTPLAFLQSQPSLAHPPPPPPPQPTIHLQIKESLKEEVEEEQPNEKSMSGIGCRSQATSPVPCLSPTTECQSQDEVELDVEAVQQADASNQTSLPGSSDDEPDEQTHRQTLVHLTRPLTQPKSQSSQSQVDLSGLELLSAASMEQIERSHSVPLAEPTKIKTEVEEEVLETRQTEVISSTEIAVKEEVSEDVVSVNERGGAGTVSGGLGLLCDVAHRFIEQEASVDDDLQDIDLHHNDHQENNNQEDEHQDDEKCIASGWVEEEAEVEEIHDPAERDMRERLAELRRLYREKQRELSRLTPRCNTNQSDSVSGARRGPGRPRKGSTGLKRPRSTSPPPPVLQPWSPPPPTLTPNKQSVQRSMPSSASVDTQVEWELVSPPSLSPAQSPSSASQKRKVGRPRKRDDHSRGSLTIVAKKSALVGLLLAKKQQQDNTNQPHKIRPKLKAEVKMKSKSSSCEEEEIEWTSETMPARPIKSKSLPTPTTTPQNHRKPVMVLAKRKRAVSAEQPSVAVTLPQPLNMPGVGSCQLTTVHLLQLPCRVLVGRAGLFYAGQLCAVRPPDLYGITLDGERSHRPHIHSREEILNDTILEVCSSVVPRPGTRVCAYWSQQYRCLYPGTTVADDDPCFVSVEFDDGDSGRISLEDIRLLPQDYPVVVYDPNPLQTLGKRRRRHSDLTSQPILAQTPEQTIEAGSMPETKMEEAQEVVPETEPRQIEVEIQKIAVEPQQIEADLPSTQPSLDPDLEAAERERRRQKKKRKEKQKRLEGERKHKHGHKHRDCLKPHRHKHKHHRHRHRHHHSKTTGAEDHAAVTLVVHTNPPPLPTIKLKKDKKQREREVESRSKMAAFLPARQLWRWAGRGYKRPGARGRARKAFYKSIQRGNETISVSDCAVFLSTGRPDRPYIGRIESMWESWAGSMVVRVKWFYHPEETVGCPEKLPFPGALFESPHNDENDVQTISHKCEVLPLETYKYRLSLEPHRLATIYDYNDTYYLAGHYDPTSITLRLEPGVDTN